MFRCHYIGPKRQTANMGISAKHNITLKYRTIYKLGVEIQSLKPRQNIRAKQNNERFFINVTKKLNIIPRKRYTYYFRRTLYCV